MSSKLTSSVDPLLIEAREIAAETETVTLAGVRHGAWDGSIAVKAALAGLKRGIELAELTKSGAANG
jgi:hypothetical protein